MKLENQVCTLEQAKKLDELGVKKESIFIHADIWGSWSILLADDYKYSKLFFDINYQAYTVAELGEMLPADLAEPNGEIRNVFYEKVIGAATGKIRYYCRITEENDYNDVLKEFISSTEADLRGDIIIWLLENNYITAQQINEVA